MNIHDESGRAGRAGSDDLAALQLRHFAAVLTQEAQAAVKLGEHEGKSGAEGISRKLTQLIALQTLEAGRQGGKAAFEAELQGRFLKAALADEVMLHTDWAGRAHWRHVLLEANLFNSAYAGQRVFADIEQLLREREPARRGVARLYLYLLSLGFQGRYRDGAGAGGAAAPIAGLRRELFEFVYQRAPDLAGREAVLSEQPYASTLTHGPGRRLSKLSRRGTALALTLLLLLAVSEVLWLWQSWAVRQALDAPLLSGLTALAEVTPC